MSNLFQKPDGTYGTTNWVPLTNSAIALSTVDNVSYSGTTTNATEQYWKATYGSNTANYMTVAAGSQYTFSYEFREAAKNTIYTDLLISWYNSSGTFISDNQYVTYTADAGYRSNTDGTFKKFSRTVTAPVGATRATLRIGFLIGNPSSPLSFNGQKALFKNIYVSTYVPDTTNEPTPPAPTPPAPTGLDIMLEIGNKNVGDNLITNPHGDPSPFGWTPNNPGYASVGTNGVPPLSFIRGTALASQTIFYVSELVDVVPNYYLGIRLRWGGFSGGARIGVQVDYYSATNVSVGATSNDVINPATATDDEYNRAVQVPANAYKARLRLTQYRWTGDNDKPLSGDYIEWREATLIQDAVIGNVDNLAAWQADTSVTWTDVIGPSHEISIDRAAMESGFLTATVLHDAYAPSVGGIVRPGAYVRCSVRKSDNTWERLYTGKIRDVNVTYPKNQTRIVFSASDNMKVLNDQKEVRGVKEIEELPYLLDGVGVPWSINGSNNTVASITQVSSNDSASLLDQILITRDSDNAYTWVDRNNVFRAMTRPATAGTPVVEFSDSPNSSSNYDSYSDIDVSFSTQACINIVEIIYLHYAAGETTEVRYGPYTDDASIAEWGPYKATFTIHGGTESEAAMSAFANAVFAKNGEPVVRANAITMPVKDARSRTHAGQIDLYDLVGVKYADKVDADIRVTGIKHSIQPDKWLVDYTFEKADSVAVPLQTPTVT